MQITTSIFLRNQTRARRVLDATQGAGWGAFVQKTCGDLTKQEVMTQSTWSGSRIAELSWCLAAYWIELARSKMPAWEMDSFAPYIQVVTGSLSKTIQAQISPRRVGTILNPFISEITLDFAPKDQVRQEHSSRGTFPTGANVTLGMPIADYTPETIAALASYIEETQGEIASIINQLFSTQAEKRQALATLLNFPGFMELSGSWQALESGFQQVIGVLTAKMSELRQENEQRIEEAAQNRVQAAMEKQSGGGR